MPEEEAAKDEIRDIAELLGMIIVETLRIGVTMGIATFENDTRKIDTRPLKKNWRELADKIIDFAEMN